MSQPKIYPNLNPAAAIPIDRDQIFHLDSFFDQYRMRRSKHHGHYVPNSKYIFVRTGGEVLMHPTYRHPAIAEGRPVYYAGEAQFDNGRLLWWSNGSGNYRPDAEHAEQAGFPMDRFYSYDEILKGANKTPGADAKRRGEKNGIVQQLRVSGRAQLNWPPVYSARARGESAMRGSLKRPLAGFSGKHS